MQTRKNIEKLENKILASYAMKSSESAGRVYDEPVQQVRTCYQRDRDRIIHSEAFRKLEYKTQVFVIFEGDYYRTRLTHTIEVAQIARTIGRSLQLNEDLIEAIALAHDLGHAPFGHAGENALKGIMKKETGGSFDHNLRSFEIVTKFEKRYPNFDGLNLSQEVLVGILKHETIYDNAGDSLKYSKIGPTLEAKVVDIADSLAYLSHDIDDGLTSGCITAEDLQDNQLWQKACNKIQKGANNQIMKYQVVRFLIDMQIRDLLAASFKELKNVKLKSSCEAKKFSLKYPKKQIIRFGEEMCSERNSLQKLLHEKLYHHYRVERMTEKAGRIIKEICDVYRRNPKQLPYSVYKRNKRFSHKGKIQIICNYIASMTDRFALDEHKKLFNPYQKV